MYIIMYKTTVGFRLRAIGINKRAAGSLGVNVEKYQIISTTLSGGMIGYHLREGEHYLSRYEWQRFLDFLEEA